MGFGVICSCCGEKLEREDAAPAGGFLFTCQPCVAEPKASKPDMTVHTIPLETSVVVRQLSQPSSNPGRRAHTGVCAAR